MLFEEMGIKEETVEEIMVEIFSESYESYKITDRGSSTLTEHKNTKKIITRHIKIKFHESTYKQNLKSNQRKKIQ